MYKKWGARWGGGGALKRNHVSVYFQQVFKTEKLAKKKKKSNHYPKSKLVFISTMVWYEENHKNGNLGFSKISYNLNKLLLEVDGK